MADLPPINSNAAIVDQQGRPKLPFVTLINQLLKGGVASAIAIAQAAQAAVTALTARRINTTAPLQGGGDLSADRTLSLANSGVTAGTYGDASHYPVITVDALGRVTAASADAVPATGVPTSRQIATTAPLTGGGDLTADRTLALAASGVAAGTYGDASHYPVIAVDALGRITAATTDALPAPGVPTSRLISTTAPLAGGGDLTADRTLSLNDTAVTPGSYGDATHSPQITIDQKGRITAASNVPISGGGGGGSRGLFSGLMTSSAPTFANTGLTTWDNQGTATGTEIGDGIAFFHVNNGGAHNLQAVYKTAPAPPYTIKGLVTWAYGTGAAGYCFGWRSSAGKYDNILQQYSSGTFHSTWNSATSISAAGGVSWPNQVNGAPLWFSMSDDGTNITFGLSLDGSRYFTILTFTKASGFLGATGYNQVMFGLNNFNSDGAVTLTSYQ